MDASTELRGKLDEVTAEIDELKKKLLERLPAPGYAVPMIVDCAEKRAHNTVDEVVPWGFADFSGIYREMLSILHTTLEPGGGELDRLFFNTSQELDPNVEKLLDLEHLRLFILNESVAVKEKLRKVEKIDVQYGIHLSSWRRRNALTLLAQKASYLQHTERERELLTKLCNRLGPEQNQEDSDLAALTLLVEMSEIDVLRKGLPSVWDELLGGLNVKDDDLLTFLGFTVKMTDILFRWHSIDTLYQLCGAFANTYKRKEISRENFENLLTILSSNLLRAKAAGTVVPFIRFGNWVRFWPYAYHAMLPELVFITAVQNKQEDLWSRTFGSKLAAAAKHVASRLPHFQNLIVATLKTKTKIGDIDIAIFDLNTHTLLICELKTVFDKFRTDFQLSNFTKQRVNFEKATHQLTRIKDAINNDEWKLEQIFDGRVKFKPSNIYSLVLLWRDPINPTIGGANYTPVITLNSFLYLFTEARGDLNELVDTISQLEKVFWVSRDVEDFLPVSAGTLQFTRELETDALPPLSYIKKLQLTDLAMREIVTLRHLPEDWRDKFVATAEDPTKYHFSDAVFD